MNDESSLFLQTLKNVKKRAFLLAQLTNTINTIHKRSGCKSENICVIISEKKRDANMLQFTRAIRKTPFRAPPQLRYYFCS